jgi:hypothetical protein
MGKGKKEVVCVIGKQQGITWDTRQAEKGGRKKFLQKKVPRKAQKAGHPEEGSVDRAVGLQENPVTRVLQGLYVLQGVD